MAQAHFYHCARESLMHVKEEPFGDTLEDDIRRIKEVNKGGGFYTDLPFLQFKRKAMNFKSDMYMPMPMHMSMPMPMHLPMALPHLQPPPTPHTPLPPQTPKPEEDIKVFAQSQYVDPENPHCKRKSLPLEKCPICKKFFRRMNTHLQKHAENQIQHTPDSLTCRYCSKVFSNLGNLTIHMRTHTGMKPYVCDVCSKGFAQSCNLTNHKRIHTGERPFKCPHCERAFTQSGNLSNHIRLHLDQKPFKCHFCERAFTQSGNLNSHIKNNHKNEYIYN